MLPVAKTNKQTNELLNRELKSSTRAQIPEPRIHACALAIGRGHSCAPRDRYLLIDARIFHIRELPPRPLPLVRADNMSRPSRASLSSYGAAPPTEPEFNLHLHWLARLLALCALESTLKAWLDSPVPVSVPVLKTGSSSVSCADVR